MILVTGGTGLIGSHLLLSWQKVENRSKPVTEKKESISKVSKIFEFYTDNPSALLEKILWVKADITDISSLKGIFEDVEWVYHCAALISFDPKDLNALIKTNAEGTANIVNLSVTNKVKKLCYVSSIATIGPSTKGQIAMENNEWNDTDVSVYGLTKHDAELEVWRGSQEGLSVVVVNPGVVLGPGFWKTGSGTFFTYAHKGKKFFLPGGTGFVSVTDVTNAMVTLMESKIEKERYILVNENLSYKAIFQKITARFGVQAPRKQIPFFALEFFWRWDWLRSTLLGKRRRLTKKMTKGLYQQEIYSNDKIKQLPGFGFENLEATLDFCCEKFPS